MTWNALRCALLVGHDWHLKSTPTWIGYACAHCGSEREGWQVDPKRQKTLIKRRKTFDQADQTVRDIRRKQA